MKLLVEGFQQLLRRDWFKRVWIIQETAYTKVAEVVCSGKSVSASVFARMLSFLKIISDPYYQRILEIVLEPHYQRILEIMPGPIRQES
jgi:hypothetical protein